MAELVRDTVGVVAPDVEWTLAASAEMGLRSLQQDSYDALLTCIELPGMNGLDLIRHVRATYRARELPIIVVSSLIDDDITWPVYLAGANAWVARPFDTDILLDNVMTFMDDRGTD